MTFVADHTCLFVTDLRREQHFYENALHFRTLEERSLNKSVSMVFMADETGTYRLQLVEGKGPAKPGFGHLAVVTDSFEQAFEAHTASGIVKGPLFCQTHQKSYFIQDPEGYETEILSLPDGKERSKT